MKYIEEHIKGKETYEEADGKKVFSLGYIIEIMRTVMFWKDLRIEDFKKKIRVARRGILFGTEVPNSKEEPADMDAQQIAIYS